MFITITKQQQQTIIIIDKSIDGGWQYSEKEKKKEKGIKHDYFLYLITYIYKDNKKNVSPYSVYFLGVLEQKCEKFMQAL